jgi:hypothetical protein
VKPPDHGPANWILPAVLILGVVGLAWSAASAMRSGTISVKDSLLGFDWWEDVTRDDQPIRFWFAVLSQWIGSAACLVFLALLLIYGLH